jgi:hypothetical protein
MFSDPLARQLYAEIASIEEQHTTQYESIIDPNESWVEKWVMHEANEVYNYYSCARQESDPRIRAIWERMVDYELGHLQVARRAFERIDTRQIEEILPRYLPEILPHRSQRDYVRGVLASEVDLRARGTEIITAQEESADAPSVRYRQQLNSAGSPSSAVAEDYKWQPGTELAASTP